MKGICRRRFSSTRLTASTEEKSRIIDAPRQPQSRINSLARVEKIGAQLDDSWIQITTRVTSRLKLRPSSGGGAEVDIVMLAVKTFPMATGEGFRDLLMAISESPDGTPKPTRLDEFAASHPTVLASFSTAGTPDSFAHEEYRGLDAFIFIDKAGRRQAVRYITGPEERVYLTADEAARQSPDFLIDDLAQRTAKKPVVFHLTAQLAEASDQTKDPSEPWPNDRQVVDLGVVTLDQVLVNSREVQKDLLFLPTNLPDGIELSDDRLPAIRSAVYGVAFARRSP
jgi:catalase